MASAASPAHTRRQSGRRPQARLPGPEASPPRRGSAPAGSAEHRPGTSACAARWGSDARSLPGSCQASRTKALPMPRGLESQLCLKGEQQWERQRVFTPCPGDGARRRGPEHAGGGAAAPRRSCSAGPLSLLCPRPLTRDPHVTFLRDSQPGPSAGPGVEDVIGRADVS